MGDKIKSDLFRSGDPSQDKLVKDIKTEEGVGKTGEATTGKGQRHVTSPLPKNEKFDNPDKY